MCLSKAAHKELYHCKCDNVFATSMVLNTESWY